MTNKIPSTPEAWEDGPLGKEPKHAQKYTTTPDDEASIDLAFGLKPISIRMEVELLSNLKAIAEYHGLGYQPLMRQALQRFVDNELKQIALEKMSKREADHQVKIEFTKECNCKEPEPLLPKAA